MDNQPEKETVEAAEIKKDTNKSGNRKWWIIGIVIVGAIILMLALGFNKSSDKISVVDETTGEKASVPIPAVTEEEIALLNSAVNKNLTYDLVNSDPDKYEGEVIQWGAKVFTSPEVDEEVVCFQAYEGGDDNNFAICYEKPDFVVEEDDFIIVTGISEGLLESENAFGAEVSLPIVRAGHIEAGTRNEIVAPADIVIPINDTVSQHDFSVNLTKVELAQDETRFFIKVKNNSEETIDFYTHSSSIVQGTKQYDVESMYDSDEKLPSEILPGVEAEGVVYFPAIKGNEKLTVHLDEPSGESYRTEWEEVSFDVNLSEEGANRASE